MTEVPLLWYYGGCKFGSFSESCVRVFACYQQKRDGQCSVPVMPEGCSVLGQIPKLKPIEFFLLNHWVTAATVKGVSVSHCVFESSAIILWCHWCAWIIPHSLLDVLISRYSMIWSIFSTSCIVTSHDLVLPKVGVIVFFMCGLNTWGSIPIEDH